ncbi:MAG: hypothetical protein BWY21_00553 [Parcubacteria group bacterium ADurb.Bin216]|nr:MAG: hypothetical protein BWY21_00553 [Parcubacteria group bacterium ADurb.Bin216]
MLVKLLPTQVSEYWPLLKGHIEDTLPPIGDWGPYHTNNILYHILYGNADIWMLEDKSHESKGFIITTVYDDLSGIRILFVYCAVIIDSTVKVDWEAEFETIKKYAYSKGCSKIGTFMSNKKALDILKEHGAETRFVFAHFNI